MVMNLLLSVLLSVAPVSEHPTIREMANQNNALRQHKLELSEELTVAGQLHAQYMADHNTMSHYVNGSPASRARAAGWRGQYVLENIAMSQPSISSVMRTWYNSSGHRANMLNTAARYCGFGCAISKSGRYYWCALYSK